MNTIEQIELKDKKVIIRVDFNVPLNEQNEVTDDTRILAAKPTIDTILEAGGSCILMSHLGRPKGITPELSLKHIVKKVESVLGKPIQFANDCIGQETATLAKNLLAGEILLLENLRFYDEETQGDQNFAKQLAELADVYVNDAFGTAHRAHASTTLIAQFFANENKAVGKLLEQEISAIDKVLKTGEKPVLAILGGSKVSSKITIIENILAKVDHLIIGGGMAYTFVKAQGGKVGNSICEDDYLDYTLGLLEKARENNVQIHLPIDVVATTGFSNDTERKTMKINNINSGWEGLDAGPESIERFKKVVMDCKTILWNGPLGVFEFSNFAEGTIALGTAIAQSTKEGAFSLVGGGDSVAAVKQFGFEKKVSYVSTGGGAMLESLEGKVLPGIAALKS
jgi:phosphoglycerate kinase